MIDVPQGIPSQIIDLAEKNVEQARGGILGLHRRRTEGYRRGGNAPVQH